MPRTTAVKTTTTTKTTKTTAVRKPRVSAAKHKAVAVAAPAPIVDAQDEIAKIAYGYFVARGFQHGSHEEDWLRAEAEFKGRS